MKISRTITIDLEDLVKIDAKIKNEEIQSLSEFVQKAVKNEIKRWRYMPSLNEKLLDIYMTFKDDINPPVPLETIKEYLELEGVLSDENKQQEAI